MSRLRLMPVVAFAGVALVFAGCASKSEFVRVRNPFESEARALGALVSQPEPRFAGMPENRFGTDPSARASAGEGEATEEPVRVIVPVLSGDPRRHTPGDFCLPCNGKGFRFDPSHDVRDYVLCRACGGTGRR